MRCLSLLVLAATCTTSAIASKIPFTDDRLPGDKLNGYSTSQQIEEPWDSDLESYQDAEQGDSVLETRDVEWSNPTSEELTADAILGNKKLGKRRGGGGGKGGGSSSGSKGGGGSSTGS